MYQENVRAVLAIRWWCGRGLLGRLSRRCTAVCWPPRFSQRRPQSSKLKGSFLVVLFRKQP